MDGIYFDDIFKIINRDDSAPDECVMWISAKCA